MTSKSPNTFDQQFNAIKYIYGADGSLVTRTSGPNIGTRPVNLQFMTGLEPVWNAVTDRIEVGVAGSGFVNDTLALTSSAPLTVNGGYSTDLSGPVSFAVLLDNTSIVTDGGDNLAVGVIDAAQHGVQTDGSLHADATAVTAGFMPPGMWTLLDTATNLDSAGTIVRRPGSGSTAFESVEATTGLFTTPASALTLNAGGSEPFTGTDLGEAIVGNNVALGTQSTGDPDAYQGCTGVVWIPPAGVAPTAAPTTGVYLWFESGNLKAWKAGAGAPVNVV